VTSSRSRFDPHPSPEAALFQGPRVAKARNLPELRVRQLAAANTSDRFVGLFGKPRVNALEIKLALDRMAARWEHVSTASTLFSGVIAGLVPAAILACCPSLPARHETWVLATIRSTNPRTG
jgi:hypothetical protein